MSDEMYSSNNSGFDHDDSNYIYSQKAETPVSHYFSNAELPRAKPIADKPYSLEPDMIFGWMPKLHFNGPIKLTFTNMVNDSIIDHLMNQTDPIYKLIYLGFRPPDSIRLHKQFSDSYHFKYEHLLQNQKLAHLMPLFFKGDQSQKHFVGMNQKINSNVIFDSVFEGGNLDAAIQINEHEFDLLMRVDSNTKGHLSWYNFKVRGLKKGQSIRLNIINFTRSKCLYTRGMLPYILSEQEQIKQNTDWKQGGKNVQFFEKQLRYEWVEYRRRYYTLQFDLEAQYDNDCFQVAYCIPYNYSTMLKTIRSLFTQPWALQAKLCQDLSGIDVPLLTIDETQNSPKKKVALIQARIHPGEVNGSWMMHGFLQYLASDQAQELRKKCILKIIPMANPDGVVLGNFRTGMAGRDLNREFIEADEVLYPTVRATKDLVSKLLIQYGEDMFAFIDMHGHSVKKNVFIYGPDYSIWDPNYLKCRILPKLLDEKTSMFRYYGCIFRVSEEKKATARGVFNDDILHCFTVEASNGSYFNENQETIRFEAHHWIEMGRIIGEGFSQLVSSTILMEEIIEQKRELKKQKEEQKKKEEEDRETQLKQYEEKIKLEKERTESMKRQSQSPQKTFRKFYVTVKEEQNHKQKNSKHQKLANKRRSLTGQIKKRNETMKEFTQQLESTPFLLMFQNIQKAEAKKQDLKKIITEKSDSEGGSDSESSQDDYLKNELDSLKQNILCQREINNQTNIGKPPLQNQNRRLRKNQKSKKGQKKSQQSSQKLQDGNKKSQKSEQAQKIISHKTAISLIDNNQLKKQPNSSTKSLYQQNQIARDVLKQHRIPHFQQGYGTPTVIIKMPHIAQSFVNQQQGTGYDVTRPLTAIFDTLEQGESRENTSRLGRFKSQQHLIQKLELTPSKQETILNKSPEELNEKFFASTTKEQSNQNVIQNKLQVFATCDNENQSPYRSWFPCKERVKNRGNYPSAFYSMKKHLFSKSKKMPSLIVLTNKTILLVGRKS